MDWGRGMCNGFHLYFLFPLTPLLAAKVTGIEDAGEEGQGSGMRNDLTRCCILTSEPSVLTGAQLLAPCEVLWMVL